MTAGMPGVLPQVADFRTEVAELAGLLATLPDGTWREPTGFKAWSIDDIVRHLHIGDTMALAAASGRDAFDRLTADIRAQRATGISRIEETRRRLDGLGGRALLGRWLATVERLCAALSGLPPDSRLPWAGPDMGVRMFTTARQMETWAHGQAIWDRLGRERPPPGRRLRNVAEIGVRTFAWAYRNRGLPVPPQMPAVHLQTPFGETWDWPQPAAAGAVRGDAVGFCQVVTQTRAFADTGLQVEGETAGHWVGLAQCFAGPPEDPPPPGSRHLSPRRPIA